MFEKASRLKIRFDTPQGRISIEDLWDLPLSASNGRANLDDIAKGLNKQLKDSDEESFVHKPNKSNNVLQLKFDIVKHIIDVRIAEEEEAEKASINKAKKQQILNLIIQKQNEELAGKSVEELTALVQSLQ